MTQLLNSRTEMLETDPEVKSYIYQQLTEFEPYVTPETIVAVVARDPRKLSLQFEAEGRDVASQDLAKLHRIAIILREGETQIQEEGLHENIFEAIREAKASLLKKLEMIHDSVISNQDRVAQINDVLQNHQLH